MKLHYLLSISLLLLASVLCGQPFLKGKQFTKSTPLFYQVQDAFDDWATKQTDLRKTKGWKYYKRWEWENASRMNADGTSDYLTAYEEAYQVYQRKKSMPMPDNRSSIWAPMGPLQRPTNGASLQNYGTGRVNCVAFHPTDSNTYYAGTSSGGIWKTTNGGQTWMSISSGLPILRISDIAISKSNPSVLYAITGDYELVIYNYPSSRYSHNGLGIYKSTDGGQTWLPTGRVHQNNEHPMSLYGHIFVHSTNSNHVLLCGFGGVFKSLDGGQTWSRSSFIPSWDVKQNPHNENTLYLASGYDPINNQGAAIIQKSTDFGNTWTTLNTSLIPMQSSVVRLEVAISPVDTNYVYALAVNTDAGSQGIYQSIDAGQSWVKKMSGDTLNTMGWYNGDMSDDAEGQGFYDACIIASHDDRNKVYTGGVNMWGSADGGSSWGIVSRWYLDRGQSIHADQHSLYYNELTKDYIVCHDGGIDLSKRLDIVPANYSILPTTQWRSISDGIANTEFYRIGLAKQSTNLVGGTQDNGTFFKDSSWSSLLGGDGMECMINHQNEQIIYGSFYYGDLRRSDDGGSSFIGISDTFDALGEVGDWVTPFEMNTQNASSIYAGYNNVYKSENGGDTWGALSAFTPVGSNSLQTIRALAISSVDSMTIWVVRNPRWSVGLAADVWMTSDQGQNWTDVSLNLPGYDVYINDICTGDNKNTAWVVCGGIRTGQKVYATTDAGVNWVNISGNLPNIPVNAIVRDSVNKVLYVGTDLGVYYRRDTETNWSLLGVDLPNVIVSELEVHQNTNKLYAATHGRGVWATDLIMAQATSVETPAVYSMDFRISPNPSAGAFNLELENLSRADLRVEIIDVLGQLVYAQHLGIQEGRLSRTLETNLLSGQYYLRLSSGGYSVVKPIRVE